MENLNDLRLFILNNPENRIKYLEIFAHNRFKIFNKKYFQNSLPICNIFIGDIYIQGNNSQAIWEPDKSKLFRFFKRPWIIVPLNLNTNIKKRRFIDDMLLHEMIHIYLYRTESYEDHYQKYEIFANKISYFLGLPMKGHNFPYRPLTYYFT